MGGEEPGLSSVGDLVLSSGLAAYGLYDYGQVFKSLSCNFLLYQTDDNSYLYSYYEE
jgi:hypothetical protein